MNATDYYTPCKHQITLRLKATAIAGRSAIG